MPNKLFHPRHQPIILYIFDPLKYLYRVNYLNKRYTDPLFDSVGWSKQTIHVHNASILSPNLTYYDIINYNWK